MNQTSEQDELLFCSEEDESADSPAGGSPWKVLVVDDDEEVHVLTRLVLRDLVFEGRPLQLLSARSGIQAREVLTSESNIALVLLDVVMESDDAGLQLVKYIRRELHNDAVRIILRTGQPGHAPEQEVILKYDINDYKEKTELTLQKLLTAVVSSLRSYKYIEQVVQLNQELEIKVRQRTKELQKANAKLQRTVQALQEGEEAGKRIQFKLLPPSDTHINGIDFAHILWPSEFMSGDFVDYFPIDDRYVGFYLADVSGHGVSSAFVTVYLKRFISNMLEQYRHGEEQSVLDPAAVLTALNSALLAENLGKHIAIFYAVIDRLHNKCRYINGGIFPWPLLIQHERAEFVESRGTPVGLFDFSQYQSAECHLAEAFQLYLFSDGVLEIMTDKTLESKMATLHACVKMPVKSLQDLAGRLGISESMSLPDDLAMLSVTRR
ncbi:PP2C family protein-serine/threonine phosphatase [Bowmanella denitrificans]